MAMKIKTWDNVIFFWVSLKSIFNVKKLRMKNFWWIFPSSVEVHSWNITSTVSINDSINVYHWVNKNGKVFKKKFNFLLWLYLFGILCLNAKRGELIEDIFHEIRRHSFTRMLPGEKYDHFLFAWVFPFVFRWRFACSFLLVRDNFYLR